MSGSWNGPPYRGLEEHFIEHFNEIKLVMLSVLDDIYICTHREKDLQTVVFAM